jgi:hypothetical protein
MLNKKFNSKYAAGAEDFFNTGSLEDEVLDPSSPINIFTPSSVKEKEEPTGFEESQAKTRQELAESGINPFTRVETLSPNELNRPNVESLTNEEGKHLTKMMVPDEESGELKEKWVPERFDFDPSKWAETVKNRAGDIRAEKLNNPVRAEYKEKKRNYELDNRQNRNVISAVYRMVPEVLKRAGYGCATCDTTGKNRDGSICNTCEGHGFDQTAASELTDIRSRAARKNYILDFHNRACGNTCNPDCKAKSFVDRFIRQPHRRVSNDPLKPADVRAKPGRSSFVDDELRYTVVDDHYKPIAPLLSRMGSKGGTDPLTPGSVCHYLNWDNVDPKRSTTGEIGSGGIGDNSAVFGPGSRDQQSFITVTRRNEDGTYDGILSGRSRQALSEFAREQRRQRPGRRTTRFEGAEDALNGTKAEPRHARAHTHLLNLFDKLTPMFGIRSQLFGHTKGRDEGRYYQALKGIPEDRLAPVNDITAANACFSGTSTMSFNARQQANIKTPIEGWTSDIAREKGVRGDRTTPPKVDTANVAHRGSTGFSTEELGQAHNYIKDEQTLSEMKYLREHLLTEAGIVPEKFDSPEKYQEALKKYDFAPQLGSAPTLTKQQVNEITPDATQYGQSIKTERPSELKTPTTTFNSTGEVNDQIEDEDIDTSDFELPIENIGAVTPPHVNEAIKPIAEIKAPMKELTEDDDIRSIFGDE